MGRYVVIDASKDMLELGDGEAFKNRQACLRLKGVAKGVTFQRKCIGRVMKGNESDSDFTNGGNYNHDTLRNRPGS